MTILQKERLFEVHDIKFVVNKQHSQILIEDSWINKDNQEGSNWIDATEWDGNQIRDFLGY